MFRKIKNSPLMFWSLEALIVVSVILVFTKISFLFSPIIQFISIVFVPVVIAGFLFFLLNPLVNWFMKHKVPKSLSIALAMLLLIGIIASLIIAIVPNIVAQASQILGHLPRIIAEAQKSYRSLLQNELVQKYHLYDSFNKFDMRKVVNGIVTFASKSGFQVVTSIGGIIFTIFSIPVILIYFLIDGDKFVSSVTRFFPKQLQGYVSGLLSKMGNTIQLYLYGQLIEGVFVGMCIFVGYSIIQMPYSFLLGFIAGICTLIPYVGSIIAIIPALIIAMTVSVREIFAVILVVIIISQIDGNFVYPNLIARNLKIHPLTIILLLYVASNLFGFLGTMFIVPTYGILKTLVIYVYNVVKNYRLHHTKQMSLFEDKQGV
ncbi:AI-2E family transporter [Xylocopilactobacillus apicola]|uniref:AI-2E family transporter n=1 Tax=Xylocopilactobacillus apicola TaxID=2932184 RepID=A0AAU9D5R1_9LACO|nr:AI-2E family transporter [Xylocopilactobacillus apicola]BDR58858.1 AI-2E family transporter [Xylocopilactobacillus apicola]